MERNTVVGVFETYAKAEAAVADLAKAGVNRSNINVTANDSAAALATEGSGARGRASDDGQSLGERIGNFFQSLFGNDAEDADYYSEAVRRGSAVVTVNARSEEEADRVAEILDSRGAIDVNARAQEWKQSGWAGSSRSAASAQAIEGGREAVIPVVKEELQVGKRRRARGGVRIYTHLEEDRVSEDVTLRDEHAVVERRPVDRPATAADFAAFKEGTIEVRETVEEPVVAKKARVVEEVVVSKQVSERTETVRDSVRHGEVDVEQLGGRRSEQGTGTARTDRLDDVDARYRQHWQTNYATAGGTYEEYAPAYQYGSTLGRDDRYRNRQWDEIELDARRDWEGRNAGGTWERFKAAVRHGWENVTGRR